MPTWAHWNLDITRLPNAGRKSFVPLLYLLLLKRLKTYSSSFPAPVFWLQLQTSETRRVGWMQKRIFRRARFELNPNIRFAESTYHKTRPLVSRLEHHSEKKLWRLFLQTWSIMRPKGNIHYAIERDFRLFFLSLNKKSMNSSLVNPRGYYNRWVNSYNFIFNLFFVESYVQLMGSRFFIEEALVFNWQYSYKNYRLYKFVQPFIMFSDIAHGEFIHDVVARLLYQNLDFLIVLDLKSHDKLLKYLKRYHVFMLGLTPINYSPWVVSYPIPAFSDSYLIQYYFLRFTLKLQMSARTESYNRKVSLAIV